MKDNFKSVGVVEVEIVSGVEVEIGSVDTAGIEMVSGVEVGICSLFVLSKK